MIDCVRAWAWIKRQPGPVTNRILREQFRCSTDSAAHVLNRLKNMGAIGKVGYTHNTEWHIRDRSAKVEDRRGDHPESINNLRVKWVRTTGNSHPRGKQTKEWTGATELEQCWKLPTVSNTKGQKCSTLDTLRDGVRPTLAHDPVGRSTCVQEYDEAA